MTWLLLCVNPWCIHLLKPESSWNFHLKKRIAEGLEKNGKDNQSYRGTSTSDQLSRQRRPPRRTTEGQHTEGLHYYEGREDDKKQLFSSSVTRAKTWKH